MKREVHLELLSKESHIVENLVNLDQVPKHSRFIFRGMPLKLWDATMLFIEGGRLID
ncbi:MAG TPA: hypothetical protein VIL22_01965 [Paenibacillaceae bacterium]